MLEISFIKIALKEYFTILLFSDTPYKGEIVTTNTYCQNVDKEAPLIMPES
jgi:hypothetical protein